MPTAPTPAAPLSAAERADFAGRLVAFQLEELNGLGDRLRFVAETGGDAAASDAARARCRDIVEALRWNAAEVIACVLERWERDAAREEDAFGPALVLEALAPCDPRVRRHLSRLPAAVTSLLQHARWT
jgi:hypothetical protein